MTEDEARDWLQDSFGIPALSKLEAFVGMLLAESAGQSLIARSTFSAVWARHIADSAQLVPLGPPSGNWVDIGSGGGLPGVVVAILREHPLVMVEPRRKRADFLRDVCLSLQLTNATVLQSSIQTAAIGGSSVISARAVTNLSDLFDWTLPIVSRETRYLLPRGENAVTDLALAERAWHGVFHVEQSITNPAAGIVIASQVRPR